MGWQRRRIRGAGTVTKVRKMRKGPVTLLAERRQQRELREVVTVSDGKGLNQPACQGEWKKCKKNEEE